MAIQKVDTFEHDISSEIRLKDASLSSIATAVGDIGNTPEIKPRPSLFIISVVLLFVCGVIGAGFVGYTYYKEVENRRIAETTKITQKNVPRPAVSLKTLSVTLDSAIGSYVSDIKKTTPGYTLTLSSYSPVFLYMIKNEDEYIEELSLLFMKKPQDKKATSTPNKTPALEVPQITATTSINTASTSPVTGTTSTSTLTSLPTTPVFEDVTQSNQNMRIWRYGSSTVVYAFVNQKALVISSSTEGILELRSAILR